MSVNHLLVHATVWSGTNVQTFWENLPLPLTRFSEMGSFWHEEGFTSQKTLNFSTSLLPYC